MGRKKKQGSKKSGSTLNSSVRSEIAGVITLVFGAILLLSLYHEGMGYVGMIFRSLLTWSIGRAAWTIPLVVIAGGLMALFSFESDDLTPRLWGIFLGSVILSGVYHLALPIEDALTPGVVADGGGYVGGVMTWILYSAVGSVGTYLVLGAGAIVSVVLMVNVPMLDIVKKGLGFLVQSLGAFWADVVDFVTEPRTGREEPQEQAAEPPMGSGDVRIHSYPEEDAAAGAATGGRVLPFPGKKREEEEGKPRESAAEDRKQPTSPSEVEQVRMDMNALYSLPKPDILSPPGRRPGLRGRARGELNRKAELLESTLRSFGVEVTVTEISHGPTITRFDVHPGPGVKVSQISSLSDDLALSLATSGVRIVAPVPGKSAVGIEVPNREVSPVSLREILESKEFRGSRDRLTLALGADITGKPLVVRLADMLHLLIAGSTGSGKSICIRCLIASILFKARPDEVRFLLIDPKVVELMAYNDVPHLLSPVVTDPRKAAGCLHWAVKEMERRYEEFAGRGVRDLAGYKAKMLREGGQHMPRIVVIIDELADMMAVARVDVEDAIQRLAQMARAAGIHLVVATQRPSVDVITGVIKANIPSRLAFAVSAGADSRTILDTGGAEKLVGSGDMLFSPIGRDKLIRAQGSYLSDEDLGVLLDWVKDQGSPDYLEDVVVAAEKAESESRDEEAGGDSKLDEAVEVVLEHGEASVSMLQRKLRVGYTRAGRLMDIMENLGVVGPHQGPKPREVLISRAMYEQQKERQGEDHSTPVDADRH